jgi:hypothetical protein
MYNDIVIDLQRKAHEEINSSKKLTGIKAQFKLGKAQAFLDAIEIIQKYERGIK